MWGENSKECELNCQCSGLITDSFRINSGNNATKRRREEAVSQNFKLKMNPHSLEFAHPLSPLTNSPIITPSKRRILGEIQNSPQRRVFGELQNQQNIFGNSPRIPFAEMQNSPLRHENSPLKKSPLIQRRVPESPLASLLNSPKLNSPFMKRGSKISRIFEDRTKFKMTSNKENELVEHEAFTSFEVKEETRDSAFCDDLVSPVGNVLQKSRTVRNWTLAKMTSESPEERSFSINKRNETLTSEDHHEMFVPQDEMANMDSDFETLHDLDEQFECDNFDQCSKYEIISTDSPDIISRGRTSSSRKVNAKNFVFGAPIAETEQSTSFDSKPNQAATRMLNFEESFEFTSPEDFRPKTSQSSASVKKSLKFLDETPTKNLLRHENSNSSIGSMSSSSLSQNSSKLRLFPSESMTSVESGFMSEIEEQFLDMEDSCSPKMANFSELLSGEIKDDIVTQPDFQLKRPMLHRSLSFNPEASRARISLFSKTESPMKKTQKRPEPLMVDLESNSKRMKSNKELPALKSIRPVLQRAYSENAASIMSALARSAAEPDLIGDFSTPFALPLTSGNHTDLKSISCDTLAGLMRGDYKDTVSDFQVIDCRYPYEFAGGHIVGARNLYTQEQIASLLDEVATGERSVLVFHCEFSLERGPKLSRYLRSSDRLKNRENYPTLHFPEIYLLHSGYSAFYSQHPSLCSPCGYTMMMDPEHRASLQACRKTGSMKGRAK